MKLQCDGFWSASAQSYRRRVASYVRRYTRAVNQGIAIYCAQYSPFDHEGCGSCIKQSVSDTGKAGFD